MHFRQIIASSTIRGKFTLLLIVFFLPAFAVIVLSGMEHRKNEIAIAKDNAMLLVHSIAAQQEQIAIGTKQMFSTLAQLPEVKRLDLDACNKLFSDLHRQYPFYSTLGATTPEGDIFAFSPSIVPGSLNLSDRKFIRDAKETLDFSAGEFIVGRISKVPSINYAYPVVDSDQKILAILQAGFNLERFADFMKKANLPEGCAMGISDTKGVRLYRVPASDASPPGKPLPDGAFIHMQGDTDQGIFEKTGEDDIDRIYAFRRLRLRDDSPPYLYITVGIPKDALLQKANRQMLSSLSILGIAALAAMYLSWLIGNFTLVKPIRQLVTATKRFADGLLDTRTDLAHTPDELGQLAKSFDDMASLLEMRSLERKRAEEVLRHSEEKYSRLFEDAVLGIFRSTPAGKIITVNPAYARMFGFDSPDEVIRQVNDVSVDLYVDPSRRKEIVRTIMESEGAIRVENNYRRKDGSTFVGNLHARAVRDRDGTLLWLEGFVEDISERKKAEDERRILESRLRQSHKMEAIGTLAGGIAHDFNNILAAIIGYTEIALTNISVDGKTRNNLEQIMKAGLRARDLIRQILVFSRMKAGQTLEPTDIGLIVKETLAFLRASFPATIEIRENINGDERVAMADPTQIHQVITNLCTNALHAMEETGGILEVNLEGTDFAPSSPPHHQNLTAGPYLKLTVSDTGGGMEPAVLERIFDPYFTTKAPDKGSGLGLAMVHGIVKRHNGAIEVRSEPMRGSCFHIYLPKVNGTAAGERREPADLPGGTETILFVDDEEILVDVGQRMLQYLGYRITGKSNSSEALRLFTERPHYFDLVITDYTMPHMTGADLAREMILVRPDIPIILSTGFTERITPEKAADLGIREFLMKPLNMSELAKAIRRVLDNGKQT